MKNMRVSAKLLVSFLILVALTAAVGAVGITGMFMMNDADSALYNENYLPSIKAGNISQTVVEQRVIVRNFVIYDVTEDAAIFKQAQDSLAASKEKMNTLLSEYSKTIVHTDDQAIYDELVKVYNSEWQPYTDTMRDLGTENRTADAKVLMNTTGSTVSAKIDSLTTQLQEINMADGEASVKNNGTLANTMVFVSSGVLLFSIIITIILSVYVSSLISKPIAVLTAFMNKAGSTGDITLRPEDEVNIGKFAQSRDEIGQCIGSTSSFVKRMIEMGNEMETVANGDLTVRVELLSDKDTMGLSLKKMVANLNSMFADIQASTVQVSSASKQIADGAQALAQGSTEQAAAAQQLSSSIAEIAIKTRGNAEMAEKAAALAGTIKGSAEQGSRQMGEMMTAVKDINAASQSISSVIKVINDIAFQTNILALNASVEAAHAGQHGKGFAVVAEEVGTLAAKSAAAAKDTEGLIANSIEKAELGARIADETAASLANIVAGINESSQLVGEIALSSEQQSAGIEEINHGIEQVAQVVQQNSATAQQSAAASEEMNSQASLLEELISQFKLSDYDMGRSLPASQPRRKIEASSSGDRGDEGFGKY